MQYDGGIDPVTGLPRGRNQNRRPGNQGNILANSRQPTDYSMLPQVGGGGIGFGGGAAFANRITTPDYAGLINNDPLYMQLRKDLAAQGVSDAASRAALTQRALVQFGQVPQFDALSGLNPEWIGQDVNDTTRRLAASNTESGLSVAARQRQAFEKQVREIRNSLAARGALRSGEAGHMLQEAQTGYDRAQYDTMQELVDFISGLQAGFAQAERARQGQLRDGASAAAANVPDQRPLPDRAPFLPSDSRTVAAPSTIIPGARSNDNPPEELLLELLRRGGGGAPQQKD